MEGPEGTRPPFGWLIWRLPSALTPPTRPTNRYHNHNNILTQLILHAFPRVFADCFAAPPSHSLPATPAVAYKHIGL